jgi:hypothetical protein
MSIFAYVSNGKFNSSAWLREQLRNGAARAQSESNQTQHSNLGIKTSGPFAPRNSAVPEEYDPILRHHRRISAAE